MAKYFKNKLPTTRGLASGGALSRVTLRRILGVLLPSEPYRYPARRQAPDTLAASGGQRSGHHRELKIQIMKVLKAYVILQSENN